MEPEGAMAERRGRLLQDLQELLRETVDAGAGLSSTGLAAVQRSLDEFAEAAHAEDTDEPPAMLMLADTHIGELGRSAVDQSDALALATLGIDWAAEQSRMAAESPVARPRPGRDWTGVTVRPQAQQGQPNRNGDVLDFSGMELRTTQALIRNGDVFDFSGTELRTTQALMSSGILPESFWPQRQPPVGPASQIGDAVSYGTARALDALQAVQAAQAIAQEPGNVAQAREFVSHRVAQTTQLTSPEEIQAALLQGSMVTVQNSWGPEWPPRPTRGMATAMMPPLQTTAADIQPELLGDPQLCDVWGQPDEPCSWLLIMLVEERLVVGQLFGISGQKRFSARDWNALLADTYRRIHPPPELDEQALTPEPARRNLVLKRDVPQPQDAL